MAIVQLIKYDDLPASKTGSSISLINNNNGTLTINSTYTGGAKNTYYICTKKLISGHKYCITSIPKYVRNSTHHIEFQIYYGNARRYDECGEGKLFVENNANNGQQVSCTFNLIIYAWDGSFDLTFQVFDLTESGIDVNSVDEFRSNYLSYYLTDIANAIRNKKGTTGPINAQDFSSEIESIQTSGGDTLKALLDYAKSCKSMFSNNTTITDMSPYFSFNTTSNVTNMSYMFYSCTNLTTVPLFDTSNVTDISNMFAYCSSLTTVPAFNVSNVTSMSNMFRNCSNLATMPLLDTSSATDMSNMFAYCSSLTSIPAFDTSKVTNMPNMFSGCSSLKSILMHGMKVSFDISASTMFEREDLVTILNNLATVTSTQTLTMGSTNLAKLTDEDKAIATGKRWKLA